MDYGIVWQYGNNATPNSRASSELLMAHNAVAFFRNGDMAVAATLFSWNVITKVQTRGNGNALRFP
jgi:hypothetical protein